MSEKTSDCMCPKCNTPWLDVLDDDGKPIDRHPGCTCVEWYGPDDAGIDVYWPVPLRAIKRKAE